jgi:Putative zinc-finger
MTCDDCRQRLQAWLDGDPPGADGLDAHLAACPACRALAEAARRLRSGLLAAPPPVPPAGLADRIVAGVIADRRKRQRSRRRLAFAGLALAVAACLAIALLLPEWGRHDDGSAAVQPTGKEMVANQPAPEPPAAPPSLNENMAEATSAVASLARRTADQTVTSGQMFVPAMPLEVPPQEVLGPPLEPPADSLREAGQGVATGLAPVTDTARRAFDLFLRDIPPVAPEAKSGL